MRSYETEIEQHVYRILYKFDIYSSWFNYDSLMNADNMELCDLIGFCLDVQESLEAIITYRKAKEN